MSKISIQQLIAALRRVRRERSHQAICDALSLIFEECSANGYGEDMHAFHESGHYDGVVERANRLLDDQKSKLQQIKAKSQGGEIKRRQGLRVALLQSILDYFPSGRK